MNELMFKEFKTFMKKKLGIKINKGNKDIFLGAFKQQKYSEYEYYSFKVMKLKGDAVLGLLACEKYIDNFSKVENPTAIKEEWVGNQKLENIFDKLKLEKYFSYNKSNQIGKHDKSNCIEALLYATYFSFGMKKAIKVFDLLFKGGS